MTLAVLWMDHDLLNTDNYVKTVAPLSSDPAVQTAVATDVTDQLWAKVDVQQQLSGVLPSWAQVFAAPLSNQLKGYAYQASTRSCRPRSSPSSGRPPTGRPTPRSRRRCSATRVACRDDGRSGEHRFRARRRQGQGGSRRQGHPRARFGGPTPGSTTFVLFRSETLAKAQKTLNFFHKLRSRCRCCCSPPGPARSPCRGAAAARCCSSLTLALAMAVTLSPTIWDAASTEGGLDSAAARPAAAAIFDTLAGRLDAGRMSSSSGW